MLERVHPNIADRPHSCENQDQRVCYHRSLQRDITREHGDTDKEELNSLKECFDKLVQHVLHNLIENQQFSTVSKLSAFYANFQVEGNIHVKGVLHKEIKRRLKQEFGNSPLFYH